MWLDGMTVKQISEVARKSAKTIRREINHFLENPPMPNIIKNRKSNLLIDGTYFKRENCLIIYHDHKLKHHQLWRYSGGEKEHEIEADLQELKRNGINLFSITSDGHSSIKSALKKVCPNCIHQRCLVHIQRFCNTYLTKNPKTKAGRELKEIVSLINQIDSHLAKLTFLARIDDWKRRYNSFLKEKSYDIEEKHWWYTHKNLRKVIYHIEEALPDMFHYLAYKSIPKDTNGLEGRLTFLKHKFRTHRGLKKEKRSSYLSWYLTTKNEQIPTQNVH